LLQVKAADFNSPREPRGAGKPPPLPMVQEASNRICQLGHELLDVKLAATWGTQLQLVEAQGNAVRFPHSMLQAYLGSRLIAYGMADDDFCQKALGKAGRELLIALVLHSRAVATEASRADLEPPRPAAVTRRIYQSIYALCCEGQCLSTVIPRSLTCTLRHSRLTAWTPLPSIRILPMRSSRIGRSRRSRIRGRSSTPSST